MNSLPQNLRKYLEGNKKHLKVIATISKTKDGNATVENLPEEVQWAIFFSIKEKTTDEDKDFNGSVDGDSTKKPLWKSKRPLWLIPVSDEAKEEAKAAMAANRMPEIVCSEITVRNEGMPGGNWQDYEFWYSGKPEWKNDFILALADNTNLSRLSGYGKWCNLKAQDDTDDWPVWFTTDPFDTFDRMIVFPAPACHIVDLNGKYIDYDIWLGVRNENLPFISIDERITKLDEHGKLETNQGDGSDCPIVWQKDIRINDVLRSSASATPATLPLLTAENFIDRPLFKYVELPRQPRTIEILADFNSGRYNLDSKSWLIAESVWENPNNNRYFHPIYLRHYGEAFKLLGDDNTVKIVQICRASVLDLNNKKKILGTSHLMVRIFYVNQAINGERSIWNKKVEAVAEGLENTSGSSPVGIVPKFENTIKFDHHYVAEWETSNINLIKLQTDAISYDLVASCFYDGNKIVETHNNGKISLDLLRADDNKPSTKDGGITLSQCEFKLHNKAKIINDNGTLLQWGLNSYKFDRENIVLRDGAFSFQLGGDIPDPAVLPPQGLGRFRLVYQCMESQRPFYLWQWYENIKTTQVMSYAVEDFSLPVLKAHAAGQDMLAKDKLVAPRSVGSVGEGFGERTEPSLLIPIDPDGPETNPLHLPPNYLLTLSESVNIGQDYRLDLRLQKFNPHGNTGNSTAVKAVMVDVNPQFIGMIDARFLQQTGYDDGAWVVARRSPFSEEAGGWEILDDNAGTEGFRLILPSQAIGEAYVKNDAVTAGEPEIDPPKSIHYRFGAPAILQLAPERLERRYVAVPWNLRRIWGQPGEAAPGIPFLEAQLELLYGLTGHLKPEKAFIAELASKLGEVPVPPAGSLAWDPTPSQQEIFRQIWIKYLQFYRAWKSRVAILEPSTGNAFGNAVFDENLDYFPRIDFVINPFIADLPSRLDKDPDTMHSVSTLVNTILQKAENGIIDDARKAAVTRLTNSTTPEYRVYGPMLEKASPMVKKGASLMHPIKPLTEDLPPVIYPKSLDVLAEKIKFAHEKNGLAGGFHYGFESEAIYKEFWREAFSKGSSSAEIRALAFSSLGGWGQQTARFASDKTVIKSTTAMGRTHFYAVERIGRIGVFWHKAKHVIEYERTVVPSIQFQHQPPHLGRPLVRKVREYIEILEPIRKYPDFSTGLPDAPGSITGCTFKSRIIPVLSAWGHDVWIPANRTEPVGWEVPLWKPGADPKVYPKPQIQLSLLPPPDSDENAILADLSEPENLWFYTDTRESVVVNGNPVLITADVHAWPSVQDVDFTDLPEPEQYDIEATMDDSPGLIDAPLPETLDILPGFERFTFRVDRNEIPASVAGRYYPQASITGRMRTVSMIRRIYAKEDKEKWWSRGGSVNQKNARTALDKLMKSETSLIARAANGFKELDKKVRNGLIQQIGQYAVDIKTHLDDSGTITALNKIKIPQDVGAPNLNYFASLWTKQADLVYYPTKWLWRESLEGAAGAVSRIITFYDEQAKKGMDALDDLVHEGNLSKDEAKIMLGRFEGRIIEFHAGFEFAIDSTFTAILKIIDQVTENITRGIDNQFDQLLQYPDSLLPKSTTIKNDIIQRAEADVTRIKETVDDILPKIEKIKNDIRWKAAINDIKTEVDGMLDACKKDLTTVAGQLAAGQEYLQQVKNEFYKIITQYKNKIQSSISLLHDKAVFIVSESKTTIADINKAIVDIGQQIHDIVADGISKIDNELDKEGNDIRKTVSDGFKSLKNSILNGVTIGGVFIAGIETRISNALYNNTPGIDSVHEVLKSQIDDVFDQAQKIIKDSLLKIFGQGAIAVDDIQNWLNETSFEYQRLAKAINDKIEEAILRESTALANYVNKEFGRLAGEVAQKLRDFDRAADATGDLLQTGHQTLNNFRSVWEEFTAPGMGLNRKTVALIVRTDWKSVEERLSLTPCITRAKQFGESLEGLGLRLPVSSLTTRLLPGLTLNAKAAIEKFDFSNLLSDIGGMRLDKLFPGFKMPSFARDQIKITHGFDKQTLMAWIDAEANIAFSDKKSLMNIGPLLVELGNGTFNAKMRVEMDIDGKMRKTNTGQLKGSWIINVAGTGLMIFRDASIIFKDGKLTFDLDPRRMEMPGLLKMLTDATQKLSDAGLAGGTGPDGEKQETFKIGMLKVGELPAGVKAELNIPPVSIGAGVTAMTNLSFGGHFLLSVLDRDLHFRFLLGVGFYLGKKEAPFNVTIFILGGGGHVDCAMTFEPRKGLAVDFAMSIHVSAALAINLGWIKGGIAIMVGFELEYHKQPAGSGSVYVSIFIYVVGQVEIISLISVYLSLLLQATYMSLGDGSVLVGTGQVQMTIRICSFVKINVSKSYTKQFAKSGGGSHAAARASLMAADIASAQALKQMDYRHEAQIILKTMI